MTKHQLTIVIPSREQEKQILFLERAIASVKCQTIAEQFVFTFVVGVDKGKLLDKDTCTRLGIVCVESGQNSQAAALNAAIRVVKTEFVAFLEDDDQWMPSFLTFAMKAVAIADFVSSTQAEYDESDELLRINDYPTPSGWFMPLSTLRRVGEFNESFRFHLDAEWLGRIADAKLKRLHMVESTAPHRAEIHQRRETDIGLSDKFFGGTMPASTTPIALPAR